jgi:thymidylate synthase (FAD)
MEANYITHYGSDLSAVNAARVSMNKESDWERQHWDPVTGQEDVDLRELSSKDEKLIHYLAKNKHTSCFEHQGVTLRLKVPLFVRSQIHRHRTFSYNEISRRYVKDDLEFYWPDKWRKAAENVKQGSSDEGVDICNPDCIDYVYFDYFHEAYDLKEHHEMTLLLFHTMLEKGVCAEQARMILPQNLYTQFYMTGNLRNWAHFLNLRLGPHAQREVQEIAKMCEEIIAPLFPISYKALMENE